MGHCCDPSREMSGMSEGQDVGAHPSPSLAEQSEGVLRLTSLVGRAAGIEQKESVLVLQPGDMRVSEDHDASLRKATSHPVPPALPRSGVVDHGYPLAAELELQRLLQLRFRWIEVAAYRPDGCVCRELVEESRVHQVAGVQDQVGALQMRGQGCRQRLRAAGDVCVGHDDGQQDYRPQACSEISRKTPTRSVAPIRCAASSANSFSSSAPAKKKLSALVTTALVREPTKGSKTRSPLWVQASSVR